MSEAFVSLATTDDYARGANVLGKSLKRSGTTRKRVLMISKNVNSHMRFDLLFITRTISLDLPSIN